jgi:hypothetical protein
VTSELTFSTYLILVVIMGRIPDRTALENHSNIAEHCWLTEIFYYTGFYKSTKECMDSLNILLLKHMYLKIN